MTTPVGRASGWQRIRKLFHSALVRDSAVRGNYLDQACAGDSDVRREVDSLIAAHAQVGNFIEEPVGTPPQPSSGPPDRPPLPAGFQVGPYELIELVGAGGMGEVYRARDPRLGREVALKVLPSDLAADPQRRERFLREARMVSALNHPNICTIHEIGCADGLDYICFEYIEGQTLADLLEGPSLSFERVIGLSLPLAEALVYAHEKGILHRDLKPANIMVSERGPKILDFGLAKVLAAGESAGGSSLNITDSGLVLGTVAYMSPEQALGRKVDERSDVFSLGTVLYEMASGKQAFTGSTPSEVLDAVLHQEPDPLPRLRPELPTGLSLVVEKALRKDAQERYQHMADLAADLRRLSAGEPTLVARRQRRILWARVAAAMAAAALIGLFLFGRWRAAPPPASPNSLAVMYFENLSDRSDADNLGRMLAGLVTTDLAASEGLQVVSSQRIFDITRQLGKSEGTPDRTVATDVARRAGAAKMVLGQVAHAGSRTVATVELVEVASGRRLGSYRAEGASSHDLFSMAEALGAHLRANLTRRPQQPGGGSLTRQLTTSAEAYRAYVRGEVLLHRREFDKAAEEFRQAVRIDPEFALAHYRFSVAASAWGHANPEARAAAERAAALKDKLAPRDRDLVEGNVLYMTGRLSHARSVLESALGRDPEHKEILYRLSECYTHSPRDADPRRAAELMERVLALDPDFHVVYNHLALAYTSLGQFTKASEKLDEWESKEPKEVRFLRGHLSAAQGHLDEALQLTESIEGLIPTFRRSVYALAAGRSDIVRSILQKHRNDGVLGAWLRQLEAHFHVHLGAFDRAEAAYQKSLPARLETDEQIWAVRSAFMLHALAELLALKGDLKAARREAERALEIQPEGPFCLYFAGLFAIRAGDIPGAERHLKTLEEVTNVARGPLVPHYRDALVAEIALARGRPSEAQPLLENAVGSGKLYYETMGFKPGPAFRDGLARTYLAAGEKKKAAEVVEELLIDWDQGTNHPVPQIRALYTLGILKFELGDRARGREVWQKFLDHWGKADWDLPEVRDARARLASSAS